MAGIAFMILFFYYFFTEPKFSTGWWWGVGFAIFLGISIIIMFILNSKRVEDYLDRKQKEGLKKMKNKNKNKDIDISGEL